MKAEYKPVVFNDSLRTGIQIIDEQHQILINMINEANDRLEENSGRDVLDEIVRNLMSYALYHFDTEEELMVENTYDHEGQEAHFREHRAFSETVSRVQQDISQGKLISREDLLSFLNGWLVNHILNTDQRLGRFLTPPRSS